MNIKNEFLELQEAFEILIRREDEEVLKYGETDDPDYRQSKLRTILRDEAADYNQKRVLFEAKKMERDERIQAVNEELVAQQRQILEKP